MRATDWNPNPPRVAGRPAFAKPARASGAGAPAMQARNAASCAAAYPAASVGGDGAQGEVGSMRRAEGEEQPGVGECRGVRAASVSLSLSSISTSAHAKMKAGCPMGTPRTTKPHSCGDLAPRNTSGPRSATSGALEHLYQPNIRVLPWLAGAHVFNKLTTLAPSRSRKVGRADRLGRSCSTTTK